MVRIGGELSGIENLKMVLRHFVRSEIKKSHETSRIERRIQPGFELGPIPRLGKLVRIHRHSMTIVLVNNGQDMLADQPPN